MKKEVISQLLELVKQAAPEVESAVSGIKDARLRAAIGAVIMQRILQEVDDTKTAALAKPPTFISPESGGEASRDPIG